MCGKDSESIISSEQSRTTWTSKRTGRAENPCPCGTDANEACFEIRYANTLFSEYKCKKFGIIFMDTHLRITLTQVIMAIRSV